MYGYVFLLFFIAELYEEDNKDDEGGVSFKAESYKDGYEENQTESHKYVEDGKEGSESEYPTFDPLMNICMDILNHHLLNIAFKSESRLGFIAEVRPDETSIVIKFVKLILYKPHINI